MTVPRSGFFGIVSDLPFNAINFSGIASVRGPGITADDVVNFRIDGSGNVTSARIEPGKSTLRNADVESCVKRQIQGLKFPAKGGAVVNYPFIFSSG